MDSIDNDVKVLGSQFSFDPADILIRDGVLVVVESRMSMEKANWLWTEMQGYRTLFSDFTRGDIDNFREILLDPWSYWLEIYEEGTYADSNKLVGIVYLTGLNQLLDADIHMMFFDRQPAAKAKLMRAILAHMFEKFKGLHRITATMPMIYRATMRLADKLGFKREGIKRESQLMGKRFIDEAVFGLLASEVINGRNN